MLWWDDNPAKSWGQKKNSTSQIPESKWHIEQSFFLNKLAKLISPRLMSENSNTLSKMGEKTSKIVWIAKLIDM